MAQLKDLQRQLTEAWADLEDMHEARDAACAVSVELVEQLHRVVRERYEEREMRLRAKAALADCLENLPNEEE